eukprot:4715157-Alexandrium_andersonii.AAC.1
MCAFAQAPASTLRRLPPSAALARSSARPFCREAELRPSARVSTAVRNLMVMYVACVLPPLRCARCVR